MNITTLIVALALNLSQTGNTPDGAPNNDGQSTQPIDRAIALDGIDDFVTVPACDAMRYPGDGGWTLELWVKPVIYPHKNDVTIVGQESVGIDARDPWTLRAHPTHFQFRVDDDHGTRDSIRFDLALGVWQHIACVYQSTEVQGERENWFAVYVDGQLIEQRQTPIVMGSRLDPVYMGALGKTRFRGLLDDVRVWSSPLSSQDIGAAARGEFNPQSHSLRGYWTFDERGGAVALDSSGNGAHALLGRGHDPHDRSSPERVARVHGR